MRRWKTFQAGGMEFLQYETPEWKALVSLTSGGNLIRLHYTPAAADLLRFPRTPAELESHPECFGTPLLLPPNRIADGCFCANGFRYHLPLNEDAYIHRNGRTARWDAQGSAFVILGPEEYLPDFVRQEPEEYGLDGEAPRPAEPLWVTLYIGKGKKDKINKVDIVGFLSKVGGLAKEDIGRIDVKEHYAFVAVRRALLRKTLSAVKGQKIKGIKTIVEVTR